MRELGDTLGADELTEWIAYFSVEPWGESPADYRSAVLATIMANQWRGKDERPATIEDFLPDYTGERAEQRRERQAEQWKAWGVSWATAGSSGDG